MNNTYVIEKESIVEVLEDIQSFENMMSTFLENHPQYSYNIDIKESTESKWTVELNIKKDEEPQNNTVT